MQVVATSTDFLNAFRACLGICEHPAHSNRTPIGAEFGWNGVAWCAETCSVCLARVGAPFFHEASVAEVVRLASIGHNGMQLLPKNAAMQPADLTAFKFPTGTHIGACEVPQGATWIGLEGNHSDCVQRTHRDRKYLWQIIRLPFAHAHAANPAPVTKPASNFEEDDLPPKAIGNQDEKSPQHLFAVIGDNLCPIGSGDEMAYYVRAGLVRGDPKTGVGEFELFPKNYFEALMLRLNVQDK